VWALVQEVLIEVEEEWFDLLSEDFGTAHACAFTWHAV
jgi:hypothetical protein